MSFGGDADEAESGRIYAACREAGINFFDCADTYSGGRAEEILGRLIDGERDRLVITSKCFLPVGPDADVNARGGNRRHILRAVENSLKRLGTDRLDVLFLHRWDAHTDLDQTLRALEDLVRDGKVVYLGVSNFAAWQVAVALGRQDLNGWSRFDLIQPMYNLVKRQAEVEILPLARAEGLGVISYGPVGGGLLSGKYRGEARPDGARLVTNEEYRQRYDERWFYETAERFCAFAEDRGVHPVSLAVAWVAFHPNITCPIIGARSAAQLSASLEAVEIDMTPDLWREIAALSRTPPPATDRLEEQASSEGP
jgi:aryl-alcohol dehydrogenase-like predicted oxidoreductase